MAPIWRKPASTCSGSCAAGWAGLQHYTDRFGHPKLRLRHMPFTIGIKERDQWLACMDQAMGETGVPEDLRTRLKGSFFQTADWMRNTHG
jgi:hemoglobin